MTEENGFNKFAEYRADYLNGTEKEKYRNIEVTRSTAEGNYIISYGSNGTAASAQDTQQMCRLVMSQLHTHLQ